MRHSLTICVEFDRDCSTEDAANSLGMVLQNSAMREALSDGLDSEALAYLPALPAPLAVAKIEDEEITCPHCGGNDLQYVEDMTKYGSVEITDGALWCCGLDGGCGECENPRLHCEVCCLDLAIPPNIEINYA